MRGRLRLRLDAVKSRPDLAVRIQQQLMAVSEIRHVQVTPRTGSVLLTFEPRALGSAEFLDEFSAAMGTLFPADFAPGCVRFRVDFLKGRPQLAEKIKQQLAPIGGIHRLEIDPSDATCLVVYDSQKVTSPEFVAVVSQSLSTLLPRLDVKKILSRTGLGRR